MSSTAKVGEHIPCMYSMSTIWTFHGKINKHDGCKCEECMKKTCKSWRRHTVQIINLEKKKMISLTDKQQVLYKKKKILLHLQKTAWT